MPEGPRADPEPHLVRRTPKNLDWRLLTWLVDRKLTRWSQRWWPYAILAAISTLVALVNVQGNFAIHFIDIAWPPNPRGSLTAIFWAWSRQNLGGVDVLQVSLLPEYAWITLLGAFGLPVGAQEVLTISLFEFITGVYAFRLFRDYLLPSPTTPLAVMLSLGAAVLVFANYATQVVFWWDGIVAGFIFAAATMASVYYLSCLWSRFLSNRQFDVRACLFALLAGFVTYNVGVPFVVSSFILVLTVPPFVIFRMRVRPRTTILLCRASFLVFLTVCIAGIASLWWLVASYQEAVLVPSALGGSTATAQSIGVLAQTAGLSPLLAFRGLYGAYYPGTTFAGGAYSPANLFFYGSVGAATSWLILGIFLVALLCSHRGRGPLLFALALLLGLDLFFLGESSPVFSVLIRPFLSNSLYLLILRNPMASFGFAILFLSLTASVLAAHRLHEHLTSTPRDSSRPARPWSRRFAKLPREQLARSPALGVVMVAVVVVPYLSAAGAIYSGDAIPGAPYQARAQIPPYEYQVAAYLAANLGQSYALLYPGGFLEQNWTHGYDGYDILPELLPSARLIYQGTNQYAGLSNELIAQAYTLIQSGQARYFQFADLLNRIDIQFVVIEGEVGGGFPFAQTTEPNYPVVLDSLNSTPGIKLAARIGADYLYQTDSQPAGEVRGVSNPIDSHTLLNSQEVPTWNLTEAYFNLSTVRYADSPAAPTVPTWRGGIAIELNNSTRAYTTEHPLPAELQAILGGSPTIFNGAPLGVNSSQYPYLAIRFATAGCAIRIEVATTPELNLAPGSPPTSNFQPVGGPADNLGLGDPLLVPSYGAGYFTGPLGGTTLVVDLQALLAGDLNKTVDYIFFSIVPVAANGSGLPGLPLADWPGTPTATIESLTTAYDYLLPPAVPGSADPLIPSAVNAANALTAYFNATQLTSPIPPNVLPIWNDGLEVLLNNSTRHYAVNYPLPPSLQSALGGAPTMFNEVPLGLDSAKLPFLVLNFTTIACAIRIVLATVQTLQNLSPGALSSDFVPVGGPADNLGIGDPRLVSSYGAGYFTSQAGGSTLVIDLPQLLAMNRNKTVDYLFFSVVPVAANGSGLPGLPIESWPGNQTVTLSTLVLGNLLNQNQSILGIANQTPSALWVSSRLASSAPPGGAIVSSESCLSPSTQIVTYTTPSPTSYHVTLTNFSDGANCAIVELVQNFNPDWTLTGLENVTSWTSELVDGFATGFVVGVVAGSTSASFTVSFGGQAPFITQVGSALAIYVGTLTLLTVLILIRRHRSGGLAWRIAAATGRGNRK